MARPRLHIGTSGWAYRGWRGPFYPADLPAARHFAFYRERFRSVEVNGTFYRLPNPGAVAAWRDRAGPGFTFAVKVSRFVSHNKKLRQPRIHLGIFLAAIAPLGPRLGPLLVQLPPSWRRNVERLERFLAAYRELAGGRALAIEFRHPSWHDAEVDAVLRRHHASFCISHLDGRLSPLTVTARMVYVRLHGSAGRYAGGYGRAGLRPWRERIAGWLADGREVFCYFDNDIGAAAPRDALLLQEMLDG
jgi:uncharacterized protein YecE (DUF72 family)